jgi:formylglycine-generating enzyme required for sulfatase activity
LDDVQVFINKLNRITINYYRLPTEAEWEYAARGGSVSMGYKYSGGNNPREVGWFNGNSFNKTHPVGQKMANELGLYDMSGNVHELCSDWYKEPEDITFGRVVRGGDFIDGFVEDVLQRGGSGPFSSENRGFRLVMTQRNQDLF